MTVAANPTNAIRLSPVDTAVAYACGGIFIPRPMVSGWVYLRAGGPFGAHRARPNQTPRD